MCVNARRQKRVSGNQPLLNIQYKVCYRFNLYSITYNREEPIQDHLRTSLVRMLVLEDSVKTFTFKAENMHHTPKFHSR